MIAKLGVILILMDIDCSFLSAADSGTVCSSDDGSKEPGSHAPWDAGAAGAASAAIVRSTSCCVWTTRTCNEPDVARIH